MDGEFTAHWRRPRLDSVNHRTKKTNGTKRRGNLTRTTETNFEPMVPGYNGCADRRWRRNCSNECSPFTFRSHFTYSQITTSKNVRKEKLLNHSRHLYVRFAIKCTEMLVLHESWINENMNWDVMNSTSLLLAAAAAAATTASLGSSLRWLQPQPGQPIINYNHKFKHKCLHVNHRCTIVPCESWNIGTCSHRTTRNTTKKRISKLCIQSLIVCHKSFEHV